MKGSYLSLAGSDDCRKPAALTSVHQQEDHIVFRDKLLQLFHIMPSLSHCQLGKVHWVAWHWDAHVVALCNLKGMHNIFTTDDKIKHYV